MCPGSLNNKNESAITDVDEFYSRCTIDEPELSNVEKYDFPSVWRRARTGRPAVNSICFSRTMVLHRNPATTIVAYKESMASKQCLQAVSTSVPCTKELWAPRRQVSQRNADLTSAR